MGTFVTTGPDLEYERELLARIRERPYSPACADCRYCDVDMGMVCTRFGGEQDMVTGKVEYPSCLSRRKPLKEATRHDGGPQCVTYHTRSDLMYCGRLAVRFEPKLEKKNERN
ncbi:MAG: hypothetical protein CL537_07785 [Alcanivoracaceae bacterium]|nr:hypothetical protein [Alcanivoracaceae bacterium]|tara:strand:- start:3418 stop:3756 length:339 start_codon:yes stop_codon:yes gene_type:complete